MKYLALPLLQALFMILHFSQQVAADPPQPPYENPYLVQTRNGLGRYRSTLWEALDGKCRPNLADCPNANPDHVFLQYNPGDGSGPEHPLATYVSNDEGARKVEFVSANRGTCKLIFYMTTEPSTAQSFEVVDIVEDLLGGTNKDNKFPEGWDNVSFDLYPRDDERLCLQADGTSADCRWVATPLRAMMQYNPDAPNFCTDCASWEIPGYCHRCCADRSANAACNGCPASGTTRLKRTLEQQIR